MYVLKYNKEHIHYINEQIWEIKNNFKGDLDAYTMLAVKEHTFISNHFPKNSQNILDLGCGLGRCGVYAYNMINKDHKKHFIFCDSTVGAKGNGGTIKGNNYNDLTKTKSFIELNNLKNYRIIDFQKDKISDLPKLDIIMSMYSVGLHFPIEIYLNDMLKVIHKDSVLIFGVRHTATYKLNNFEKFKKWFNDVKVVDGPKRPFPECKYLILKNPKLTNNIIDDKELWKEYKFSKNKRNVFNYN